MVNRQLLHYWRFLSISISLCFLITGCVLLPARDPGLDKKAPVTAASDLIIGRITAETVSLAWEPYPATDRYRICYFAENAKQVRHINDVSSDHFTASGLYPETGYTFQVMVTIANREYLYAEQSVTTLPLDAQNTILTFGFKAADNEHAALDHDITGIIENDNTIRIQIPAHVDPGTGLVPYFTTDSSRPDPVTVEDKIQVSGITRNDFSRTVIYQVTSRNDLIQTYFVTVTTDTLPVMLNHALSREGGRLTADGTYFDADGDEAGPSFYRWYYALDAGGPFILIDDHHTASLDIEEAIGEYAFTHDVYIKCALSPSTIDGIMGPEHTTNTIHIPENLNIADMAVRKCSINNRAIFDRMYCNNEYLFSYGQRQEVKTGLMVYTINTEDPRDTQFLKRITADITGNLYATDTHLYFTENNTLNRYTINNGEITPADSYTINTIDALSKINQFTIINRDHALILGSDNTLHHLDMTTSASRLLARGIIKLTVAGNRIFCISGVKTITLSIYTIGSNGVITPSGSFSGPIVPGVNIDIAVHQDYALILNNEMLYILDIAVPGVITYLDAVYLGTSLINEDILTLRLKRAGTTPLLMGRSLYSIHIYRNEFHELYVPVKKIMSMNNRQITDVFVMNDHAYILVAHDGIYITPVADITTLKSAAYIPENETGSAFDIAMHGTVALVSQGDRQVKIFDIESQQTPVYHIFNDQHINAFSSYPGRFFIGTTGGIYTVTPGSGTFNAYTINRIINSASALLASEDGLLCSAENDGGASRIHIYDITTPDTPQFRASLFVGERLVDITLTGDHLTYITKSTISICDISDVRNTPSGAASIRYISQIPVTDDPIGIKTAAVDTGGIYVAVNDIMYCYDRRDNSSPVLQNTISAGETITGIQHYGNYLFVTCNDNEIKVINPDAPHEQQVIEILKTRGGGNYTLRMFDKTLYVCHGIDGFSIVK